MHDFPDAFVHLVYPLNQLHHYIILGTFILLLRGHGPSLVAKWIKNLPARQET